MPTQAPQPLQAAVSTRGPVVTCCCILPCLLAAPMPMFFSAPPNPASSWPLRWLMETSRSASAMSAAMKASVKWRPPGTGRAAWEAPLSPSAMITGAPKSSGS